ncbi:PREDICTED: protein SSUH2 homolog [Tarenaya hassleriana]|uniref:protein SSUH2 homolog n=1 Tax=Tarenaya hassleriana TaxID=28532 RepID=UPI00053C4DA3|nr:PREDICTED: protein SSUH2 homolog [Tarenaya hassleriana]
MEEPLLSAEKKRESEKWGSYQYLQRTGSSIRNASIAGAGVTVEEIRSASSVPDPPALYPPVISTPVSIPIDQAVGYPSAYGPGPELQRQIFDEVEIRELLIDHVGHRCCWGSRPARRWKIHAVEDCNVYVGTLDTFIEEREIVKQTVPFTGGNINGKKLGAEPGIWELDLKSEFPSLFIPYKETQIPIPNSETVEKCHGCTGRGEVICPMCNVNAEPGFYKENQTMTCSACYGRGLIAHRDGSDTICISCNGKGKLPCPTCQSHGLIKCQTCNGSGSLSTSSIATVRWKTLSTRKVSARSGAASVPDEVFHRAQGVQLSNTQAYQCTPAYFADSYFLNKFSSDVISMRSPVPPTANVVCERHTVSVVPVTRVTMSDRGKAFNFYIIGFGKEVYLKDYYPARFCWGFCPCLEWLKV